MKNFSSLYLLFWITVHLVAFGAFLLRESAENLCGCLSEPLAPRVIKLFPLRTLCSVFHFGEAILARDCGTHTSIGGHIINGYGPSPEPDTQDGVSVRSFVLAFSVHCRRAASIFTASYGIWLLPHALGITYAQHVFRSYIFSICPISGSPNQC